MMSSDRAIGGGTSVKIKERKSSRENELLDPAATIPRGTPAPPLEFVLQLLADVFMPKQSASLHNEDAWRYYMLPAQDAWWYYTDVYRNKFRKGLEELDFRSFVLRIWNYVDAGCYGTADAAVFADHFIKETRRIPCAGVIILNSNLDQILLVQGSWSNAKWSFPKGKLKEGEAVIEGAIREVEEEIGINVRPFIVEGVSSRQEISGREITVFLAVGLSTQAKCSPQTRREIADIRWHYLRDVHTNKFQYPLLIPFLKLIGEWIEDLQRMLDADMPDPTLPQDQNRAQSPIGDIGPIDQQPPPPQQQPFDIVYSVPQPPPGYNLVFVQPQPQPQPPYDYPSTQGPPMVLVPQYGQPQPQPQQIVYITQPQQPQQQPQQPVAMAPWWPPH